MYSSFSQRYHPHPSRDDSFRRVGHSGTRRHSLASEPDGGYIRATGYGGLSSSDGRRDGQRRIGSVGLVPIVSSVPHYPHELTTTDVGGVGRHSFSSDLDRGYIRPTGYDVLHGGLSSFEHRRPIGGSIGCGQDPDDVYSRERHFVGRHVLSSSKQDELFRESGYCGIPTNSNYQDGRVPIGCVNQGSSHNSFLESSRAVHGCRSVYPDEMDDEMMYHPKKRVTIESLSRGNCDIARAPNDHHSSPVDCRYPRQIEYPLLSKGRVRYDQVEYIGPQYNPEDRRRNSARYHDIEYTTPQYNGSDCRGPSDSSNGSFTAIHNGMRGTFIPNGNNLNHEELPNEEESSNNSSIFSSTDHLTSTQSSISSPTENILERDEYPPHQISTDNDELLSSFLSLPQYQHLLNKTIDNIIFLFEEYTVPTSRSLSSMGQLSTERWLLTRPRLHCVMQNTSDTGMYYLAKSAATCHYQVHIRSLIKSLIAYEGVPLEVFIYNPTKDYSNDFMVVGNTVQATKTLNKKINWASMKSIISDQKDTGFALSSKSSSSSSTSSSSLSSVIPRKRKRQSPKSFVDFGWTSSTCQTRSGSQSGVALPRLKPGTDNLLVKKLFSGMSKTVKKIVAPWIDSPMESLFQDCDSSDRQVNFQNPIVEGNIIEAIRVAKSTVDDLCAPHEDTQNSLKRNMTCVLSISRIESHTRYVGVGFGRKSIDVAEDEAIRVDPFTSAIVDFYQSTEIDQRSVTPNLLTGPESSPIPSFPVISNVCNLNPFSYQLTFVELVLRLVQKFDLNMIEIISVVTCYEIFPNCLYYFGVAANIFLQDLEIDDTKKFRGTLFGYKLSEVIMHIFHTTREVRCSNFRKSSTGTATKLPPSRFNCYTSLEKITTLQSFDLWEERCNHKFHHLIMFNDKYWKTKNQPSMKLAYGKLLNQLKPYAPNCGTLTLQHEVAILSSLGLLPLWVFSFASVNYEGKSMKYFQETFPCIAETDEKKRISTIITLTSALNEIFATTLTVRDTENIICKAYRSKKNTNHFRDIIFPNQCVIDFRHDGFKVYDLQGQPSTFLGSLIKLWPCAGGHFPMSEIVKQYKAMIAAETNNDFSYATGMRPTSTFLNTGNEDVSLEFKLPFISYGDKSTKSASRRITDKVLFR